MNLRSPAGSTRGRRRVGRGPGTGSGCTSGRGNKGQKARSGYGRKLGFEGGQMPLIRRMPKRGFRNGAFARPCQVVNTGSLNRFADGDRVDYDTLLEAGLVSGKNPYVKLLGKGELARKLLVVVHRASKSARAAVEKLGGSVETGGGKTAGGAGPGAGVKATPSADAGAKGAPVVDADAGAPGAEAPGSSEKG
jgi:large subunit ribosomal protein L15